MRCKALTVLTVLAVGLLIFSLVNFLRNSNFGIKECKENKLCEGLLNKCLQSKLVPSKDAVDGKSGKAVDNFKIDFSVLREEFKKYYGEYNSRDFFRYDCQNLKRVGGQPQFKQNSPNDMFRIDGAWFVCFDKGVAPVDNDCNVLSFGINNDDSFDEEINNLKKCNVYSFDPFQEPPRVHSIRNSFTSFRNTLQVKINEKWSFYNMGIVSDASKNKNDKIRGWMATFDQIIDYLNLRNKVIDIFKMDIEGPEFDIIINMDMDYMCTYVKQFMLETHAPGPRPPEQEPFKYFQILSKLEKCFSLFYRHTRFFIKEGPQPAGWASEWQINGGFALDIHRFKNETEIATFMYTYGELYFLNENFLTK